MTGLPIRLTVPQVRASMVLDELRANAQLVHTVDDIARLPRLAGWAPEVLDDAIARLRAGGAINEDGDRLLVTPSTGDQRPA